MNKFKEKLNKELLIQSATYFVVAASTVIPFYATDIANNLTTTGTNVLQDMAGIYMHSLFPLFGFIAVMLAFFSKNDKIVGYAKKAGVGCFVVYIIAVIISANPAYNIFTRTADTVSGWINQ